MCPVESAADRQVFVSSRDFGVTATYDGNPLDALFDDDYFSAEFGGQVAVEGSRLRLQCASEDLPDGGAHGKTVVITRGVTSTTYKVREVHPGLTNGDGTGFIELVLEAQ